ncbi:MAG: uroporphyrinogen decarboxylase [Planctomycetes bacterium]|nr:uroporphyrinogen decarboxylase [Planctomycetota bacterium]
MSKLGQEPLFLAACHGRPVPRPPLWLMRQAGRYMPEYHEVRAKAGSFLKLCHTPELAAEVTLQPIRRFHFDASIVFSDILVPAEAMGLEVQFLAGEGPKVMNPVRTERDVDALEVPDPREASPAVFETIKILRRELPEDVPLIGFVAAPWTLFAYLVEGGGSRNYEHAKTLAFKEPEVAAKLLNTIVEYSVAHATAMIESGAQAFQLFDTWAELLSPEDYRRFALPYANEVLIRLREAIGDDVPRIYFCKGTGLYLDALREVEAEVLSIDWRLDLERARAAFPDKVLQGNLDPLVLYAGPEETRRRARALLAKTGGQRHVVNLGHGILPQTPHDSVDALCEEVRGFTCPT